MGIKLKEYSGFHRWNRPAPQDRACFVPDIDDFIADRTQDIRNTELRNLLINAYCNTLDTTLYHYHENDILKSFVITGDIRAMWLRDSTAQVWQYLPLLELSTDIRNIVAGLIRKQSELISLDPYANAFYHRAKYGVHKFDLTPMKAGVHERKWELDSLCYHVDLCVHYFKHTRDLSIFDADWISTCELIVKTLQDQQRIHNHGPYTFDRITTNVVDTLSHRGYGPKYAPTGMIASSFRASDDACVYPFNIPANLFAEKVLKELVPILELLTQPSLVHQVKALCADIRRGLDVWAIEDSTTYGKYLRFEIDGLGNSLSIDEPNSPNLSALAYLEVLEPHDPIFINTATLMNSQANPWYFSGKVASGIGSPHTGKDRIWPMAMILNMFNQSSEGDIEHSLRALLASSAGTGLLHESFHKDDPSIFTRPWFAWCNSLFADVVIKIMDRQPGLIEECALLHID